MTDLPAGHPDNDLPPENLGLCDEGCARHALNVWRSLTTGRELRLCDPHTRRFDIGLTEQGYHLVRSVPLPA